MQNEEEEHGSKLKELLEPISEAVKKIGLAKILLAIILVALALWFFSLPKPANLLVTVSELDANQPIEGALVSLQWQDGQLIGDAFTSVTDGSGVVSFSNVPSARSLTIVVEGTGKYDSSRVDTTLQSGEGRSEPVKLAKTSNVNLSPNSLTGAVSETCVKETTVTISNQGDSNIDAIFVGDGVLQNAVSSEPKTVFGGSTENATVLLDVSKTRKREGETLTGSIRLKGLNKKININLVVSGPPKVDVTPSSITCPANRPLCLQVVTVKNNGDTTLNNLKVEPASTITAVLENGDVERYYQSDSIPPGGEAKFGVRITPSTPTIGVITIRADCFSRQIDVQAG